MSCPRCQHATADAEASCARCGAPLRLGEEPRPAPLDRVLDLDRRLRRPADPVSAAPATGEGPAGPASLRPGEPAWIAAQGPGSGVFDLGAPLDDPAGLAPAPAPPDAALPAESRVPVARRVGAAALDAALVGGFAAVPVLLAARSLPGGRGPEALISVCAAFVALLCFTYAVLGHALMGATVGKRLLGLRVTGPGGTPPGLARSAARAAVAVIGTAGLGIGMVVGLFTRSGRTLHDIVAGTSVVCVVDPPRRGA